MMIGNNYPVPDYLKENILDGITISRGGGWWTVILLIQDQSTKEPFIKLYRWKLKGDTWKLDSSFPIKKKNIKPVLEAIREFSSKIFFEESKA